MNPCISIPKSSLAGHNYAYSDFTSVSVLAFMFMTYVLKNTYAWGELTLQKENAWIFNYLQNAWIFNYLLTCQLQLNHLNHPFCQEGAKRKMDLLPTKMRWHELISNCCFWFYYFLDHLNSSLFFIPESNGRKQSALSDNYHVSMVPELFSYSVLKQKRSLRGENYVLPSS